MTQDSTSATGLGRPRVRRGLGLVVGVTVALTPAAIAPAAAPAAKPAKHAARSAKHAAKSAKPAATSAKHVLRVIDRSNTPPLPLLGGGGGRGYGPIDGLGSLLSRVLDIVADLIDGDRGPRSRR